MTFELRLGGTALGTSELEHLDQGVAYGRFHPTDAYQLVELVFRMFSEAEGTTSAEPADQDLLGRFYKARDALGLTVHGPTGIVRSKAVLVRDYRFEGGAEAIELEVILDGPLDR